MTKIVTADNLRDTTGRTIVVNTKHHGPTRRPPETLLDDKLTAKDIHYPPLSEGDMNNPNFGNSGQVNGPTGKDNKG